MAEQVRLYDVSDSPFCLKVRACLNLKEVPHARLTLTARRSRETRRLYSTSLAPVLVINGAGVSGSSRIARLLDDRFSSPPLLPRDDAARAYCHLVEDWADEALSWVTRGFKWLNPKNRAAATAAAAETAGRLVPAALAAFRMRARIRRRYAALGYTARTLSELEARMGAHLACLDHLLGDKPFLLGKYVTLADIAVYAQLAWLRKYEERRLLASATHVCHWIESLDEVDALRTAI